MGWMIGVLGFDSWQGLGIFLFTTASRTALGPTQPPIQWVLGALSPGIKRPGREADHSPPSSAEVKECVELYLHPSTPSWHGAQLKKAQGQLYINLNVMQHIFLTHDLIHSFRIVFFLDVVVRRKIPSPYQDSNP
jgi:hypothetical protein